MTVAVAAETERCDRCFRPFPKGSLVRDAVDAALLFCASCVDFMARPCAYCELQDQKPIVPAVPGWLFGTNENQQWNSACKTCAKEKKLFRRIDTERMSAREALKMLSQQLKKERLGEEGLYIFDYQEQRAVLDKTFWNWRWISCYVVTGSCEGHYVHIEVRRRLFSKTDEEETHLLSSVKTFMGRKRAYKIALRCAELLGA